MKNKKNNLSIKSSLNLEISSYRKFEISIQYYNHHISYDDIYFDELELLTNSLDKMILTRKGEIVLDGGMRFVLKIRAKALGEILFEFRAEQFEPEFPGECILIGYFEVDGDLVQNTLSDLSNTLESEAVFCIS